MSGIHGNLSGALGVSGLGGLGNGLEALRQQSRSGQGNLHGLFGNFLFDNCTAAPEKPKPKTIREELQAETDEWLKDY